jgi:hypothetical protein
MPHDAEVSEVMTDLCEVYWPALVWVVEGDHE